MPQVGLTWPIVLAVLFGAMLHASWNALVKSGADKTLDTALIHLFGGVISIPILFQTGLPAAPAWPFLAVSVVLHFAYYIALAGAYKHGDFSLTYPLMRGLAPMLVMLSGVVFLQEAVSGPLFAGVLAITLGVALLGWDNPAQLLRQRRGVAFALANALVIALYTVVDGKGVRVSQGALSYVAALTLIDAVFYPLLVLWTRLRHADPIVLANMNSYVRARWPVALAGGAASLASYGIALWAMTKAPVAAVAALRETSVLFAALIGTVFLREVFGVRRAIGTMTIFAGILLLRLG